MQKLTHMRQDFWVSFVKKFFCNFFPMWWATVFKRFWKTLQFPFSLIFLLPILNYIFCVFMLYHIICKEIATKYTMSKPKYWQKPRKTAILAVWRRDIFLIASTLKAQEWYQSIPSALSGLDRTEILMLNPRTTLMVGFGELVIYNVNVVV